MFIQGENGAIDSSSKVHIPQSETVNTLCNKLLTLRVNARSIILVLVSHFRQEIRGAL